MEKHQHQENNGKKQTPRKQGTERKTPRTDNIKKIIEKLEMKLAHSNTKRGKMRVRKDGIRNSQCTRDNTNTKKMSSSTDATTNR